MKMVYEAKDLEQMLVEKTKEKYPNKEITAKWDSYDKEMIVIIKDIKEKENDKSE